MVTSPRLWRPRLVFWIGALATGVISTGFALLADEAQHIFARAFVHDGWQRFLPLLVSPAGFMLCAWLAYRFLPGSQGSGIPQVIAARHLRDDAERSRFLSLKMAAGKIALTVIGPLSGSEQPAPQSSAAMARARDRMG